MKLYMLVVIIFSLLAWAATMSYTGQAKERAHDLEVYTRLVCAGVRADDRNLKPDCAAMREAMDDSGPRRL